MTWPSKINVSLKRDGYENDNGKKGHGIINNMIMEKLRNGKMPWKQTWKSLGPPRNYVSKKPYRAVNALILINSEYEYPLFLTFLQVKELGGYIKKGSKCIEVIYWKTLEFENDEKIKRIPFLMYYNVFNIDCVEGVKLKFPTRYVNDPIECCETIINDNFSLYSISMFPRITKDEVRLFTLLEKAYSDSRYDEKYAVSTETVNCIEDGG